MRLVKVPAILSVCLLGASGLYAQATNYSAQIFNPSYNYSATFGSIGSGALQMVLGCGVAVNPTNSNIFIADLGNHRIEMWTGAGAWIGSFGSFGGGPGQLAAPCGLAFAPNGNLYIADTVNARVAVFSPGNPAQTSWNFAFSFGGPGTNPGQFSAPFGVAILPGSSSSNFTVYVVDSDLDKVQMFTAAGGYTGQFGQPGSGPGQFMDPIGIAIASNGNILVTDSKNARIERFGAVGNYLGQFGGTGQVAAHAMNPWGIAVAPSTAGGVLAGRILVADFANSRVIVYNSSGNYVTQYLMHLANANQVIFPMGVAFFTDGRQVVTNQVAATNNNGGGCDDCNCEDCRAVTIKK